MKHPFEVGETYRNNLGEYEVVSIDEPDMTIKMEDGTVIETTVKLQRRILKRLKWEKRHKKKIKRKRRRRRRKSRFTGLRDSDFQSGVKGTSWRARTGLGGLLAEKLSEKTPYDFQSYAVYGRPEAHVVLPDYYDAGERERYAKFCFDLTAGRARYAFYIEKIAGAPEAGQWANLLQALEGNEELQDDIDESMRQLTLHWEIFVGEDEETPIARVEAGEDDLVWQEDDDSEEIDWATLVERLRALPDDRWHHLYLGDRLSKEEAIEQSVQIAELATDAYRLLLPLYEASTGCDD
jgi:hypothetical protein